MTWPKRRRRQVTTPEEECHDEFQAQDRIVEGRRSVRRSGVVRVAATAERFGRFSTRPERKAEKQCGNGKERLQRKRRLFFLPWGRWLSGQAASVGLRHCCVHCSAQSAALRSEKSKDVASQIGQGARESYPGRTSRNRDVSGYEDDQIKNWPTPWPISPYFGVKVGRQGSRGSDVRGRRT